LGRTGQRQDRAEDRAHARRPADRERDADGEGAEISRRLLAELPLLRASEEADPENAHDVEPEDHDERAPDPTDPVAIVEQELPGGAERSAERDEDEREAQDERDGVDQNPAARRGREVRGEVGDGHARDERYVRRQERQPARRQERKKPRRERDREAERLTRHCASIPSTSA